MGFGSFIKKAVKSITKATSKITGTDLLLSGAGKILQVKPAPQAEEQTSASNNTAQSIVEEDNTEDVVKKKKLNVTGKSGLTVKRPNITGSLNVGGGTGSSGLSK